jgi:hypothetical protein
MAKVNMTQAKSKHRRTPATPTSASPPERFFVKDLGDEAPSFQTMQSLFTRAAAVHARRPWREMEEDNLVVVEHPATREACFCSVMGSAGEARAIQVYIGAESYFWFRKLHADGNVSLGEYLANQYSVFVHFVNPGELAPPDRELAKSMKHPLARGTEVPFFRTIRPGYHPWFVTENEARILAAGLEGVLVASEALSKNPRADLWSEENIFPLVQLYGGQGDHWEYNLKAVAAPIETPRMPKPGDLDQPRIQSILNRRFPSADILEVDHFFDAASIGGKHERKACMRVAMAIESKSGFAFPPQVGAPEESTGKMLQQVVLAAIEAKRALPAQIHVLDREFKILLDPLAELLGFSVNVRDELPALQFARDAIQEMLGGMG